MNPGGSFIFLAEFFNQAAGDEILKLFVGAQAKHFFPTAHRVTEFEVLKNTLE